MMGNFFFFTACFYYRRYLSLSLSLNNLDFRFVLMLHVSWIAFIYLFILANWGWMIILWQKIFFFFFCSQMIVTISSLMSMFINFGVSIIVLLINLFGGGGSVQPPWSACYREQELQFSLSSWLVIDPPLSIMTWSSHMRNKKGFWHWKTFPFPL